MVSDAVIIHYCCYELDILALLYDSTQYGIPACVGYWSVFIHSFKKIISPFQPFRDAFFLFLSYIFKGMAYSRKLAPLIAKLFYKVYPSLYICYHK